MSHSNLDLSELTATVGRVFMAGMPGPTLDPVTETLIRDHGLGGIILFARNIEDPVQIATLCRDLQQTALKHHGIPLFIAVDQEGGRVARLQDPFTRFPGNRAIGEAQDPLKAAAEFADVTAREMARVGLNMNMAPVVDVHKGKPEKHLTGRTFSDNPSVVTHLGQQVIRTLQQSGIMAVAKHFPGLGRATMDPHRHLPIIDVDETEMETVDLPPFQGAIEAGVSSIMSSHALYPVMDPDTPATLSVSVIDGVLRKKLGFDGLVITDDLEMGAIKQKWGVVNGAVRAFEAGCDILLICENQHLVLESMDALKSRLLKGEVPTTRLHEATGRINKAKARFLGKPPDIHPEQVMAYFQNRG